MYVVRGPGEREAEGISGPSGAGEEERRLQTYVMEEEVVVLE